MVSFFHYSCNLIGTTKWGLCHHSTVSCLTTAGYTTAVNCFWGFAIITPPFAVDLKYPIISAFTARIVVCSFCVITAFPFGQTQPWKKNGHPWTWPKNSLAAHLSISWWNNVGTLVGPHNWPELQCPLSVAEGGQMTLRTCGVGLTSIFMTADRSTVPVP